MKIKSETKVTFIILLFILLITLAIIIPLVIKNRNDEIEKSFPQYKDIDLNEKNISDTTNYSNLLKELENDYYFRKVMSMPNYNSSNVPLSEAKKLLFNYIYNYELSNKKYFTRGDNEKGIYCMKKDNFLDGFSELYNIDATRYLDVFSGYEDLLTMEYQQYCLNFDTVAKGTDNEILVGIDYLNALKKEITVRAYVFEFYDNYRYTNENTYNTLKNYMNNRQYSAAQNIVVNNFNGKVSHKEIVFKKNTNPKYFNYQVIRISSIQ